MEELCMVFNSIRHKVKTLSACRRRIGQVPGKGSHVRLWWLHVKNQGKEPLHAF
ncbi:hypothetical protein BC943DRAFT_225702 [Umbelopsis sp. AD052]|nr:hypothetical protein BC943DRAFT_225702 [Umbelopsis sp. AD052]